MKATPWLACPGLSWLGLYPSDIERHCGTGDLITLPETEYEAARGLLQHPSHAYVNDRVRAELAILLDRGSKVELDALARDTSRLVDYLQRKLSDGDLIQL